MTKEHHCTKCSAGEMVLAPAPFYVRSPYDSSGIALGFWATPARIEKWVCLECGYIEQWVRPDDLPRVQAKLRNAQS